MESLRPQPIERLLDEHASFVRGVARALVLDESRADDVAQDTWLAALKHPPARAPGVRGWLAKVARNFSFRVRRDEARRTAREERAAVSEISRSPASDPARALMLREVIDAVLALEEPYRSTLLMRYYENLDPSEIAIRLVAPAATVRTRLKRGLDQLRDRFDAAHGGNRAAWTAPLLPVALGALKLSAAAAAAAAGVGIGAAASSSTSFTGITLGGIIMAKKLALAGAIAAIAVVSVVIATRGDDAPTTPDRPVNLPVVAGAAPQEPADEAVRLNPSGGVISPKAYVPGEEDRIASEAPLAPKGAPRATLTGRVVDASGAPQAGVPVALKVVEMIAGEDFVNTEVSNERRANAKTGADGRFSFADVPVSVEAKVRARPEKLCDAARSVVVAKPGPMDLGDLVATQGGSVAGTVVSPQGTPVKGSLVRAWNIEGAEASQLGLIMMRRLSDGELRSATTNASGQYRIDGLAEGACGVSAATDENPEEVRSNVPVRKNEVTWDVDFKLAAGLAISGMVRGAEGAPFAGAEVTAAANEINLDDPARPISKPKSAVTGADGRFTIQGLRADTVTVRARKPGYITATQRGAAVGTEVALQLKPSGIAFGHVRNAATNAPIANYALKIANDEPFLEGLKARVLRGAEAAKAAGVDETADLFAVVDLPDAPVKLEVRAEEFAEAQIAAVRAPSGGKAEVNVSLLPQAMIKGVVVDSAGAPVAGAKVFASSAKPQPGDVAGPTGTFRIRRKVIARSEGPAAVAEPEISRAAVSGADGSYTIKSLPAGSYRVTASHKNFADSAPAEVALKAGEVADGVRLAVEVGGTFAGTAYDADGNALSGARVMLAPQSSGGPSQVGRLMGGPGNGISEPDGSFEITGLKPGEYLASLGDPPGEGGISFAIAFGDEKPVGEPVTIEAGKTTRKDLRRKPLASLSGIVKEGGKPAANIRVSLVPDGAPMIPGLGGGPSAKTDDQGQFLIERVAPGDYTACFDPPGAPRSIHKTVTLAPRNEARMTVDLPTGAIEGRVTDKDGKPIPHVTLSADPEALGGAEGKPERGRAIFMTATADNDGADVQTFSIGGGPKPIQTDSDGRYRLRYVEPGKYKVSIKGEGVLPQSRKGVEVAEARTTRDVDFSAEKGATLLVTIDPAGHDAGTVIVFVDQEGVEDGHDVKNGSTKAPIKFTGLKPGRYHVRADAPMKELEGSTDVDVVAGQEARVTVRLAEQQ